MSIDVTRAPIAGETTAPQSITATATSTAEQPIAGNGPGGAVYEFTAAGFAHLRFGLTGVGAADATDFLVTDSPRRIHIDPAKSTHVRAIRNGASDVAVSFHRVR